MLEIGEDVDLSVMSHKASGRDTKQSPQGFQF